MASLILVLSGCSSAQKNVASAVQSAAAAQSAWPTAGWRTSTPEQQGLDSAVLSASDERIEKNYPNLISFLVVRHGYLVYEKYYGGMTGESANPVYSVTKSVSSALTGIALKQKYIQSVDQKVSELLPEYFTSINDKQKKDITIKNVLTMTGGLESADDNYISFFSSSDWVSYTLQQPMKNKPGKIFEYNTGLTHLLSAIVTKTTQKTALEYANQELFAPMGVKLTNWYSVNGLNGGGVGLSMKPRDMAKFGYLYLHKGTWDGKEILPEAWVNESTQKQISVNDETDYGYLFWLENMKDKKTGKSYFTFRADGAGGQVIMCIPGLDMVVVLTADLSISSIDKTSDKELINDYVLPAVQ